MPKIVESPFSPSPSPQNLVSVDISPSRRQRLLQMNPDLCFLVVDDFSTMRRIIGGLLRQCGVVHILEAEDGVQALRAIEGHSIDFVVSDWNMPNMTGLELLKTLRAHPKYSHMPLLLVTAEGKKENIVEAAQAGADGYIVKPFTQDVLQEKVTRILSRRAQATA